MNLHEQQIFVRQLSPAELVRLFEIIKLVTQADSIDEEYSYVDEYTTIHYESDLKCLENEREGAYPYLEIALEIFSLFKKQ